MARLPQDALGMETGEPLTGAARPSPEPEVKTGGPPEDSLVGEVVSLFDGIVEYLRAIFRLESYRIEARTRRAIRQALVFLVGVSVTLFGLVFVSVGVSSLLSTWLLTPYAGPLIVGGFYLIAGLVAILVASRKQES